MANYQDLRVWQKAMDLTIEVYALCSLLPRTETYGLASQMKRAAVSIPSNIAEGQRRLTKKDSASFAGIALGSLGELETQLILASKLYRIDINKALLACSEVGMMCSGLIKSLRSA